MADNNSNGWSTWTKVLLGLAGTVVVVALLFLVVANVWLTSVSRDIQQAAQSEPAPTSSKSARNTTAPLTVSEAKQKSLKNPGVYASDIEKASDIGVTESGIDQYHRKHGSYPQTLQALKTDKLSDPYPTYPKAIFYKSFNDGQSYCLGACMKAKGDFTNSQTCVQKLSMSSCQGFPTTEGGLTFQ